jgi:pyruvate kinase
VLSGGPVADNKGINLPGVTVSSPSLTAKDRADLEYMLREPIDLVALSFVRSGEDIGELRRFLADRNAALPIIAKIEKPQAWDNLDAVLDASDGIMVARGDLGVEVALEKVPFMQKAMITRARAKARFVITATQMLESMISNPAPTRAEVSDVANAIADGSDAVMLSAETSVGRYPLEAVRRMACIVEEAERSLRDIGYPSIPETRGRTHPELIADAAFEAAQSGAVEAIVVFTMSGSSARLVARYRPPVPVFAFTPSEAVAQQLAVVYGTVPLLMPDLRKTDEVVAHVDQTLTGRNWLPRNATVAVVAGLPPGAPGNTNLLRLHRLG